MNIPTGVIHKDASSHILVGGCLPIGSARSTLETRLKVVYRDCRTGSQVIRLESSISVVVHHRLLPLSWATVRFRNFTNLTPRNSAATGSKEFLGAKGWEPELSLHVWTVAVSKAIVPVKKQFLRGSQVLIVLICDTQVDLICLVICVPPIGNGQVAPRVKLNGELRLSLEGQGAVVFTHREHTRNTGIFSKKPLRTDQSGFGMGDIETLRLNC